MTERAGDWVASVPVVSAGHEVARLEVARGTGAESGYVRDVVRTQLYTTLALLLTCAVICAGLGMWLVGRPVQHLIEQARRVARGDFSPTPASRQTDELGQLTHEMNAMAERLATARRQVRDERRARTAALEQLRHADRLSTVGKLASGMAHELGTPLNVVSGRGMMIASGESTPDETVENANIIVQQAEHMTGIIRRLLDFSRRRTLRAEAHNLREVLEHAALLVEPIAEERDVRIDVAGVPDLPAQIDAGKTLQVMTNLMMNAIQAMPEGGTIAMTARRARVDKPPDRAAAGGEFACVEVSDEGVGIEPEALEHIFEPFFTTKREGEGTGLGLSVCHAIVREHGGWIEVDSEPGRGSRFRVYLPVGETR
jgi:signal transduction histidine kinase